MDNALKAKLENVVDLVSNVLVDPDIRIDYYHNEQEAYILVKYAQSKYTDRKIRLAEPHIDKSAEDIANLVTFYIEQYMEEIDSLQYGAQ